MPLWSMTQFFPLMIICSCYYIAQIAEANWLYLAIHQPFAFTVDPQYSYLRAMLTQEQAHRICSSLLYLNEQQRRVCAAHPYTMHSVSVGIRLAIAECQWQFRPERWNCTPIRGANESAFDIFGTMLKSGNRESAFLEAITTAGLVHAIVTACTTGNLTDCSCDMSKNGLEGFRVKSRPDDASENWRWGGCSDNIRYGIIFAREFLDKHVRKQFQQNKDSRDLVILHNQEVGRKAISENMKRHCRCHGISGSCEMKTCWQQMPKMKEVSEQLKLFYDRSSIQVTKRAKRKLRRKNKYERKIPLRISELVYQNRSPNYCVRDDKMGLLGTYGRQCNRTTLSSDSCDLLCCGRGYDTRLVTKYERCHCKFVWCCYVTCKACNWNVEMHTCK
uniref:Protein Wnt n=3 Tax=Trichinella spiralis TaxID=6334 RepID=F8QZP4_TRISP|nr:EGL-20 [Trichinella spiralis]